MRARLLLIFHRRRACGVTLATAWAQKRMRRRNTQSKRGAAGRPPKEPAPPPSVTMIGARDAHGMLGRDVRSAADEDMGRIVDVIVDRAARCAPP